MASVSKIRNREQTAATRKDATRKRLILAAERLFGTAEIGAVSLRQINKEAGQRNSSALHYHFGSREAIIEAIFEYRMGTIDARRNEMLDELVTMGLESDLRSVVGALVWPLAEQMKSDASGQNYVRFLARANQTPHFDLLSFIRGKYDRALIRVIRMISNILRDIPGDIRRMRILNIVTEFAFSLAHADQLILGYRPELRDEILLFTVNDLIDRIAGALYSPVSSDTRSGYTALIEQIQNSQKPSATLFESSTSPFGSFGAMFGSED